MTKRNKLTYFGWKISQLRWFSLSIAHRFKAGTIWFLMDVFQIRQKTPFLIISRFIKPFGVVPNSRSYLWCQKIKKTFSWDLAAGFHLSSGIRFIFKNATGNGKKKNRKFCLPELQIRRPIGEIRHRFFRLWIVVFIKASYAGSTIIDPCRKCSSFPISNHKPVCKTITFSERTIGNANGSVRLANDRFVVTVCLAVISLMEFDPNWLVPYAWPSGSHQ